jgi:hypothetical protein
MKSRSIITLLVVCAVSLTTAARTPTASARWRFETEDEPQLSNSERSEALDLVARFSQRLQETNDFGQIVDELFVKDFSERTRQAPLNSMPWWLVDEKLVTTAEPFELRRYYVAGLNFYRLLDRIMDALKTSAPERADDDEAEEAELDIKETLTPEVMNVLLSDPTIAALIKELEKDEEDDGTKKDDGNQPAESGDSTPSARATAQAGDSDDDANAPEKSDGSGLIKSLAQLKGVSNTLERANELMRQRLTSLSLNLKAAPGNLAAAKDEPRVQNLNQTVVNADFYGYPKGTQVIHADLLPFCLTMMRQNGQLRILSVTIYVD